MSIERIVCWGFYSDFLEGTKVFENSDSEVVWQKVSFFFLGLIVENIYAYAYIERCYLSGQDLTQLLTQDQNRWIANKLL
jgi:hypothetical protein